MKLSARVRALQPSPTLQVKAEADRLRSEGVDVIDFGPGEPDFDTPAGIRDAAKRALDAGDTHYGPTAGKPALRRAVARDAVRRHGGGWTESEVVIGAGGKGVLFLLAQAVLDPGDEALLFSPYWVSFPEQVRIAGGTPVIVDAEEAAGFVPDPEAAARRITPRCRAIILCSPSNPTGAVLPAETLDRFADLAAQHDLWLVVDETYDRFVYPGVRFTSGSAVRERSGDRVVVVSAFSKTYAMTGWRLGFGLGPESLIRAIAKLQGHDNTHPASFAQTAAVFALEGDDGSVGRMLEEYGRRRDRIVAGLQQIPGVECRAPEGAFYVFPAVRDLCRSLGCASSAALAERLIREARIAVVPGEAFGREGFLRFFSYALAPDRIDEGLRRIRDLARGRRRP